MMYTLTGPLLYFAAAAVITAALLVVRARIAQWLLLASYFGALVMLTWHEFHALNVVEGIYLKADPMAVLFLCVLSIIGAATAFAGMRYALHREDPPRRIAVHNAALVGFLTMLSGVYLSRHIGMVWAFLEASTLAAAVLIYYNRNKHSVEATWKYVFVCSVGIAIAFAGILFLSIAGSATEVHDLSFDALVERVALMDPMWLKISFLFMLTGFSVKMGVVPLFSVDIDAKDGAPSHVSALLSSVLMMGGFTAIYRMFGVLAGTAARPWLNELLVITGLLSVAFAAIYVVKVGNVKRLLAYSSLEHAGIILIAVGAGAWYAAMLHLILHAFAKSSLFLQYAHYFRLYRSKEIAAAGDYARLHPAGAGVLILGLLAIIAAPPMGTFWSEILTIATLFHGPLMWVTPILLLLLVVIAWALIRAILAILFHDHARHERSLSLADMNAETIVQYALLGMVIWIGFLAPQQVIDFINRASLLHP